MPLLRRMAIVRAEEDLVTTSCCNPATGKEARKLIDTRRRQAEKVVERWIGAGVVSVMPLPVVDLLATAAVNAQMVVEMAESTVVN